MIRDTLFRKSQELKLERGRESNNLIKTRPILTHLMLQTVFTDHLEDNRTRVDCTLGDRRFFSVKIFYPKNIYP